MQDPRDMLIMMASCEPWMAWVAANALLHATWVAVLACCQTYQVIIPYSLYCNIYYILFTFPEGKL